MKQGYACTVVGEERYGRRCVTAKSHLFIVSSRHSPKCGVQEESLDNILREQFCRIVRFSQISCSAEIRLCMIGRHGDTVTAMQQAA